MTNALSSRHVHLRLICFAATLAASLASGEAALSGRVIGENQEEVPRSAVILQNLNDPTVLFTTTSDRQGRYAFPEVPDGDYFLEASEAGFVGVRLSPIRLQFPLVVRKDLILAVAPGNEGGVYASAEVVGELKWQGRRLPHARICLRAVTEACTETNGIGQYFLAVRPGSYEVVLAVNGEVIWRGQLEATNVGPLRDKIQPPGN